MRFNHLMLLKLLSIKLNLNCLLDEKFERIVNSGFINIQGCYFLKAVANISGPISKDSYFDEIEIEHSFNLLHIDSIDQHLELSHINKQDALVQSLIFIARLFEKWRDQFGPLVLVATLSESDGIPDSVIDYSITISFYVKRSHGNSWLADDLEAYNLDSRTRMTMQAIT